MSRSPTFRLLVGLLVTLIAVTGFSWFTLRQVAGLRRLQSQLIDLNRHDSLLLLQVQNDLNSVGLVLRDMLSAPPAASHRNQRHMIDFESEFNRLRYDLEESIRDEASMTTMNRRPDRERDLKRELERFRASSDEVFRLVHKGDERGARILITADLARQQMSLSSQVLHLLERNNEAEERGDEIITSIYNGVERNLYIFLAAMMVAIVGASSYLMYSNRRIFHKLESLSRQRRTLAVRLINVQEEVLRSVSRELHDEFGQILTAVGAMLVRAERKGLPPDSPLREELSEIRLITHNTLEKMRSLSQMLHPAVLDDYGLAKGIEWYVGVFQRQTGIRTDAIVEGVPVRIVGPAAINCYRIVQEALNNTAKHSGAKRAEVRMLFLSDELHLDVIDYGRGMPQQKPSEKMGLGLIAMRERAELINGAFEASSKPGAGTTIRIRIPLDREEAGGETSMDAEPEKMVKFVS